jgi:hypothetical protein
LDIKIIYQLIKKQRLLPTILLHHRQLMTLKLSNKQYKLNHKHSKTRVRVEHIFGRLKNSMNNALSLKVIGLDRIKSITRLLNLTYNFLRYEQLVS